MITDSDDIFISTEKKLINLGFTIVKKDRDRPWGGFFVIDEQQAASFVQRFFPEVDMSDLQKFNKLSPKILLVAPGARLSWQYHHRRAELWRIIEGAVGIVRSDNDKENEMKVFAESESVRLAQRERHRLIGLKNWGTVAEIWMHTDAENPSDEEDIVRVQDDYARK